MTEYLRHHVTLFLKSIKGEGWPGGGGDNVYDRLVVRHAHYVAYPDEVKKSEGVTNKNYGFVFRGLFNLHKQLFGMP